MPWALLSLAGMFILHSLVGLWQAISILPNPQQITSTGAAPRAEQTIDIESLFGKAPSLLKITEGGLLLRGIFTSSTPETGSAIIGTQGKPPKLYIVGDRLPNGTTLVAVHDEQVVLEKAGEQSMLLLPASRL